MPIEDMPFDENGEPVDIVLNPLGVPKRMNVGQVLETHLGWAAKGIGERIGQLLDARDANGGAPARVREYLEEVYNGFEGREEDFDQLSDDEVLELAGNLTEGLPIATPVFDGAKEEVIKKMLELSGLPGSGQTTLYDGRNGREVRFTGDDRLHVHDEAESPGGRQDARAIHRILQSRYPAAAGREGAVWRSAVRGNGGSGRSKPTEQRIRCRRC